MLRAVTDRVTRGHGNSSVSECNRVLQSAAECGRVRQTAAEHSKGCYRSRTRPRAVETCEELLQIRSGARQLECDSAAECGRVRQSAAECGRVRRSATECERARHSAEKHAKSVTYRGQGKPQSQSKARCIWGSSSSLRCARRGGMAAAECGRERQRAARVRQRPCNLCSK